MIRFNDTTSPTLHVYHPAHEGVSQVEHHQHEHVVCHTSAEVFGWGTQNPDCCRDGDSTPPVNYMVIKIEEECCMGFDDIFNLHGKDILE